MALDGGIFFFPCTREALCVCICIQSCVDTDATLFQLALYYATVCYTHVQDSAND